MGGFVRGGFCVMKLDIIKCKLCKFERTIEAGQMEMFFMDKCPKCGGYTERIYNVFKNEKK